VPIEEKHVVHDARERCPLYEREVKAFLTKDHMTH